MISERDKVIYNRVESGELQTEIAKELSITSQRISQIYNKVKRSLEEKSELELLCIKYTNNEHDASRILRTFKKYGITTLDQFKDTPIDEIWMFDNIGYKSLASIKEMKKSLNKHSFL